MNVPKLHHYVPQFYLKRFADEKGRLWIWDKTKDVSFHTRPASVAAEKHFYRMLDLAEAGHDPLTMEKQFSDLEGEVSAVTDQWLNWFKDLRPGKKIRLSKANREIVSLYVALQYLRTADTRDILCALSEAKIGGENLSSEERTRFHTTLLWNEEIVHSIAGRIKNSIWVFGRNGTDTPFLTSDNPVAFKTPDNRQWLKVGILSRGMYVVFPLSPMIVMYCYERKYWAKLAKFDACISPVNFNKGMVDHENSGQVFMASRFVISPTNDFRYEREFAKSIGTDLYAPKQNRATSKSKISH
jgi:hypothetical protein